jgi:hypothetical protein
MNTFRASLKEAEQKLTICEQKIEKLEKERATLRHLVAVLRAKLGMEQIENPNLTELIELAVKATTREDELVTPTQVVDMLKERNIEANLGSVKVILHRLYQNGRLISYLDKPAPLGGSPVYGVLGPHSKSGALEARRALAEKSKRGMGR